MEAPVGEIHRKNQMYLRGKDPAGKEFSMKKLALVALFAVAVFGMAFAAETGSVAISGSVAEVFALVVPGTYTGTIANGSSAETWAIGNVKVTSNVKNWKITVASASGGYLVLSGDTEEKIAYTMTLGSLVSDQSLSSAWTSAAQPRTPKAGNEYALSIKFGPSSDFYQTGTYGDTLTITISRP